MAIRTTDREDLRLEEARRAEERGATWGRAIFGGAVAGVVAGMVMAMWTMVAGATFADYGFFTPLYFIAAPFVGVAAADQALAAAPADAFVWFTTAGVVGAAVHMVNSMVFGMIFGLIARWSRLGGAAAVFGGIAYGLFVMFVMEWPVLPLVESTLGGDPYVAGIASFLGWGTWIVAHVLFGAVLGLWPALRPQDTASPGPVLPIDLDAG